MSIWRNDISSLGYDREGLEESQMSVRNCGPSNEEERVKAGDSRSEAGEASYHVLFPIAVGAVFLAALVLGALLG